MKFTKSLNICILTVFIITCLSLFNYNVLCAQNNAGFDSRETAASDSSTNNFKNANEQVQDEICNKDVFLYDWFKRGGLFMWPILLAAALAMGLIIERFLFNKKAKLKPTVFLASRS